MVGGREMLDVHAGERSGKGGVLLDLQHVTLRTPDSSMTLVEDLSLQVLSAQSEPGGLPCIQAQAAVLPHVESVVLQHACC